MQMLYRELPNPDLDLVVREVVIVGAVIALEASFGKLK